MRRGAPEEKGRRSLPPTCWVSEQGRRSGRAAGLGAGRALGTLCRELTLSGTLNHLPGAAFPKPEVGSVTRACLLLYDFSFHTKYKFPLWEEVLGFCFHLMVHFPNPSCLMTSPGISCLWFAIWWWGRSLFSGVLLLGTLCSDKTGKKSHRGVSSNITCKSAGFYSAWPFKRSAGVMCCPLPLTLSEKSTLEEI